MKTLFRFLMILVPCMALASCTTSDEPSVQDIDNTYEAIDLTPASRSAASQLENFYIDFAKDAFSLYDSSLSEEDVPNMVVSPLSATVALGMLANGTDADTQSKIAGYLGVDNLESLNELCNTLLTQLPAMDIKSQLSFANALWAAEGYLLKDEFTSPLQSYFDASVQYLNFGNAETVFGNIGSWISSATNNRITGFLPELPPSTCLVMANAFYFQSQWADEYFDKKDTAEECFHGLNAGETMVDMMHSSYIDAPYANDGSFEYASIPFGNGAYSISFLLPNEELTYDDAVKALDRSRYDSLVSSATGCHVKINVPRLDIGGIVDVLAILKANGIDLSGSELSMLEEKRSGDVISISQGANFSMDEEGTTVAATTVEYIYLSAQLKEMHTIDLNRPFLFFITEKGTNACLLAGRVVQF